MKRRHFAILWVAAGAMMFTFHLTRGPTLLKRDAVASAMRAGAAAEASDDAGAVDHYHDAETALDAAAAGPGDRLAVAIAQLRASVAKRPIPDQIAAWDELLKTNAGHVDTARMNDVRATLASLHFTSASLLARAGTPKALWRDEADLARQQFAYVARSDADPARAVVAADDVERAYRLMSADALTLRSRPLRPPEQQQQQQIQQAKHSMEADSDSSEQVLGMGKPKQASLPGPEERNQPAPPRRGS